MWIEKNYVTLHPQKKRDGSLAQLNRASDYGSEGCGFESRGSHKEESHDEKLWLSSFSDTLLVAGGALI